MHLQSAMLRLKEMEVCSQEMERMLKGERKRLKRRVEAMASKIADPEARYTYYEDMAEDWAQITTIFPNLFRSAFIAKCTSEFENLLLAVAKRHQAYARTSLAVGDLKGDGIQKAKLYFLKVANMPFPSDTAAWSDICHFAEIRNWVIHTDSQVPANRLAGIRSFVKSRAKEFECDEKGIISFSDSAAPKIIGVYVQFLKEFMRRLR